VPQSMEHDAIVEAVGNLLKKQRRDLLAHVERRFELAKIQAVGSHDRDRDRNFHERLCKIESELRQLQRERGRR
jgi:hypothetical protein